MPSPSKRHRPHNIPHIIAVITGIGVYFLARAGSLGPGDHSALVFGLIAYLALAIYLAPAIIAAITGIVATCLTCAGSLGPGDHSALVFGLIAYLALAIYLAPAIIAYHRNTVTKGLNFIINLIFGWTFLGWVLSLAMAVTAQTAAPRSITLTLPDGRTIEGKIE